MEGKETDRQTDRDVSSTHAYVTKVQMTYNAVQPCGAKGLVMDVYVSP